LRKTVLEEWCERMGGYIGNPDRALFLAQTVIDRDKASIPGPVRGQGCEVLVGFIYEIFRRAAAGEVENGEIGTTNRGRSPDSEPSSIGGSHGPAVNFRGKRDAAAFSSLRVEDPDTGFAILRTPDRRRHALPVTGNPDLTPVGCGAASMAYFLARAAVPFQFRNGKVRLIDQHAIGGEVVGNSISAPGPASGNPRPFLWRQGKMSDLNTLVQTNAPLYLLTAFGINDAGEIVGFGATEAGDIHAYLAVPEFIAEAGEGAASSAQGLTSPKVLPEKARKQLQGWFRPPK
jgi:probable HAF family extracellular repeat protein